MKIRFLFLFIWFIFCILKWILHSLEVTNISTHLLWFGVSISFLLDIHLLFKNFTSWRSSHVTSLQIVYYSLFVLFYLLILYQDVYDNVAWIVVVTDAALIAMTFIQVVASSILSPLKATRHAINGCPEEWAELPSKATFWWLNEVIYKGRNPGLMEDDVFYLRNSEDASHVYKKLKKVGMDEILKEMRQSRERLNVKIDTTEEQEVEALPLKQFPNGNAEDGEKSPEENKRIHLQTSLFKALFRAFGSSLFVGYLFMLVSLLLQYSTPFLLQYLLEDVIQTSSPAWRGYVITSLFFFTGILASVCHQQYNFIASCTALRIHSALISFIYKKMMNLTAIDLQFCSTGHIVNLITVDVHRIQSFIPHSFVLWTNPIEICICIILLYYHLGYSTLVALTLLACLMPFNFIIIPKIQGLVTDQLKWKDERLKWINNLLNGIRVLKMYAWELLFQCKIHDIRKRELTCLARKQYAMMCLSAVSDIAPYLVVIATFTLFTSQGYLLTPSIAFVSLTLFNKLRQALLAFPWMINFLIDTSVSMQRVQSFLNQTQTCVKGYHHNRNSALSPLAIKIRDATFVWNMKMQTENLIILKDVNLEVAQGKLIGVMGKMGTGKSSLLAGILGDLLITGGEVVVHGGVAYVPQIAWLQNLSIKENILFGQEENVSRYNDVIQCCCLVQDFIQLADGDDTVVGDNGINLSGGQKQRINLARAVYQVADIYLLDDPLSSVDVNVAKELFANVIGRDGILNAKTRIFVSNDPMFLRGVDDVVVLGEDGKIEAMGSFEELRLSNATLMNIIEENAKKQVKCDDMIQNENDSELPSHKDEEETTENSTDHVAISEIHNRKTIKEEIAFEEQLQKGSVSLRVFGTYLLARGVLWTMLGLISYATFSSAGVASNIWIQRFSDEARHLQNVSTNESQAVVTPYLTIYGLISLMQLLAAILMELIQVIGAMRAAKILHENLLKIILRAPLYVFDITPIGRIINRFSKDMDTVDTFLASHFHNSCQTFFTLLGSLTGIAYTTPDFLYFVPALLLSYVVIQRMYIPTARQLRRMASNSRSLIYSHFTESLNGSTCVRAFGQTKSFIRVTNERLNTNVRHTFLEDVCNHWLDLRMQFMGCFITLVAVGLAVFHKESLTGGLVGLSITSAIIVTDHLRWMVLQATAMETSAVSVERIAEYRETPQESAWYSTSVPIYLKWPFKGDIQFHDYSAKYRESLPLVLKKIELHIRARERIGVIGRTGSGKTSLAMALYRFLQPIQGSIVIDGLDITELGLHQLRSNISIIPQDPFVFQGTLRENLDPMNEHNDSELWETLRLSHLHDWVHSLPNGLEYEFSNDGQNLSVGQMQLICLARAMLKKAKVLILDEATAATDQQTEDLIMKIVFREFSESTIVIISHRLVNVVNTDRVVIMNEGRIIELGSPNHLAANSDTHFHQMIKEAGLLNSLK